VSLLEFDGIRKPADRVTQSPNGKLYEDILSSRRIVVTKEWLRGLPGLPDLDPAAKVIALAAVNAARADVRLVEDIAGV